MMRARTRRPCQLCDDLRVAFVVIHVSGLVFWTVHTPLLFHATQAALGPIALVAFMLTSLAGEFDSCLEFWELFVVATLLGEVFVWTCTVLSSDCDDVAREAVCILIASAVLAVLLVACKAAAVAVGSRVLVGVNHLLDRRRRRLLHAHCRRRLAIALQEAWWKRKWKCRREQLCKRVIAAFEARAGKSPPDDVVRLVADYLLPERFRGRP